MRQREEYKRMEEMEREAAEEEEDAGATNYEQYRQIEPYYRDRDICWVCYFLLWVKATVSQDQLFMTKCKTSVVSF